EAEGKAGQPGDERGGESGKQEKCQIKGEHAHGDASATSQTSAQAPLTDDGSSVGSRSRSKAPLAGWSSELSSLRSRSCRAPRVGPWRASPRRHWPRSA